MHTRRAAAVSAALVLAAWPAGAQLLHQGEEIRIARRQGEIRIDGLLDDEGWTPAPRVERWYEFNPGDNVEPRVRSIAWLAYDDRFLYAAFEFLDPDPGAIRAPLTDRDRVVGSGTDYGGLFMDTRNDGHSATIMMVTAAGVQYDAVTDDAAGEDQSPDFFWDSATRITDRGWTAEIRVPFSSLRYREANPQTWGIALYRNYPRDYRYQIASVRVPRGSNCTVCLINTLTGLERLPTSQHVVVAPYVSTTGVARAADGPGTRLTDTRLTPEGGLDVKWIPDADTALDFALNPDFSQVEADTAQITANELFALSFDEKRPFFLEGVELLSTPIRAVYTRSITSPRWGARATGKAAGVSYTTLVAEDTGGGSVVIPGPSSSSTMAQDFTSYVLIARAKRDIGRSFLSVLVADREGGGGRHNRVAGPDFQWRAGRQVLTGQVLVSDTRDPGARPARSHAADVDWRLDSTRLELNTRYKDAGDGFRADAGFIPQVGVRELSGRAGWTARPAGLVRRVRMYADTSEQEDRSGALIARLVRPAVDMDVRWNGFVRLRLIEQRIRSEGRLFDRRQLGVFSRFNPSQRVEQLTLDLTAGRDADFANLRPAHGVTLNVSGTLNLTRRLAVELLQNSRRLDVHDAAGHGRRLLAARVSRVRGHYMFAANSFLRVIGQYASTTREPGLFLASVRRRTGTFSGSVLFAYKLNWQSVMFVGYGEDRALSTDDDLRPSGRQLFAKVSYAFQR